MGTPTHCRRVANIYQLSLLHISNTPALVSSSEGLNNVEGRVLFPLSCYCIFRTHIGLLRERPGQWRRECPVFPFKLCSVRECVVSGHSVFGNAVVFGSVIRSPLPSMHPDLCQPYTALQNR